MVLWAFWLRFRRCAVFVRYRAIYLYIPYPYKDITTISDNQKPTQLRSFSQLCGFKNSGDNGIRTRGLCVANAALSQLSYVPIDSIIARLGKNTS